MKQTIKHGAQIDALTPAEAEALVRSMSNDNRRIRVRAAAVIALDGTGSGQAEVYTAPMGYEFEARRVTLGLDSASDPSTGNVPLNVAGKSVEYLRSGTRIEYAVPLSPNAAPQVPGVQTWGAEQGPYLRNAEVFEIRVTGLTPNGRLSITVEGFQNRPPLDR